MSDRGQKLADQKHSELMETVRSKTDILLSTRTTANIVARMEYDDLGYRLECTMNYVTGRVGSGPSETSPPKEGIFYIKDIVIMDLDGLTERNFIHKVDKLSRFLPRMLDFHHKNYPACLDMLAAKYPWTKGAVLYVGDEDYPVGRWAEPLFLAPYYTVEAAWWWSDTDMMIVDFDMILDKSDFTTLKDLVLKKVSSSTHEFDEDGRLQDMARKRLLERSLDVL